MLAQQTLFLPRDAGVPVNQQAQLTALLDAAARSGYRIRVALIASPADLGSVTELWSRPQSYAKFLGQELGLVYDGPLLVVMPNGLGLFHAGRRDGAERSVLARLSPRRGTRLGAAALTAIQHLAAAAGHPLSIPSAGGQARSTATDAAPWIAFAAGWAVIALAWTASLRARPLRLRKRASA